MEYICTGNNNGSDFGHKNYCSVDHDDDNDGTENAGGGHGVFSSVINNKRACIGCPRRRRLHVIRMLLMFLQLNFRDCKHYVPVGWSPFKWIYYIKISAERTEVGRLVTITFPPSFLFPS